MYKPSMKTGRPAKTPRTDFGIRLKNLREEANLSQREVAFSLGISQPSYAAWERKEVALTPSQLQDLADILCCEITDFFIKQRQSKKGRVPTGKAHQVFTKVSELPRNQQIKIVDVVEALLAAQQS